MSTLLLRRQDSIRLKRYATNEAGHERLDPRHRCGGAYHLGVFGCPLLAAVSANCRAVTVIEVSVGTLEQTITATGSVEARRKVLVTAEPGYQDRCPVFQ